jgi:hypothetical protein
VRTLAVNRRFQMKSFFEATYSGAEVTKFDVYFGLFNIDFWNAFVVKQNFVELN